MDVLVDAGTEREHAVDGLGRETLAIGVDRLSVTFWELTVNRLRTDGLARGDAQQDHQH